MENERRLGDCLGKRTSRICESTENSLVGSRNEDEKDEDDQEGTESRMFGNEKEGSTKKKIDGGY